MRCLLFVSFELIVFLGYKKRGADFWSHLLDVAKTLNTSSLRYRCLAKWLFSDALVDRDPQRIVRLYKEILRAMPTFSVRSKTAIAIVESAIWLHDREVAEGMLLSLATAKPRIDASSINRLRQLFAWRFNQDLVKAAEILSPLGSTDYFLPYLHYFAKAVIAETAQKKQDALENYRRALSLLPPNSREYGYAQDRCNELLNSSESK